MATFSRVSPTGWSQGDNASNISRVSPTGWEQSAAVITFLAAWTRGSNILVGRAMKKNTSGQIIGVQMISATDGSAFTSTVSALVTKDGGSQTAGGGTVTHEGNGFHSYTITQSETDADHVAVTFTGSGAVPATIQVYPSFPQTGDSFARLGAPAGASIAADLATIDDYLDTEVAAIKAKTDNLPASPAAVSDIPSAASIADAVWDEALSGHTSAGTAGKTLDDIITDTADIQSRLPTALIGGRMDAFVGAMDGDVITSSVLAGSAITEIQSGLPTAAEVADAVWDEALSGHVSAGTAGKALDDILTDTATIGAPVGASISADIAAVKTQTGAIETDTQDIQSRLPAALVSGRMDASVGAMAANTLTASALASDAVTEIQSGLSTLDAAGIRTAVGLASANLDTQLDALPTAAETADAVWDEALSGHTTAGSAGKALSDSGSASDPWATSVPGAYAAGTAGKILGDYLDAAVSTRATQTSVDTVDDLLDTEVAAIKAKTDLIPASPAAVSDIPSAASVATAVRSELGTELGRIDATISSRATQTSVDTVDDLLDTEIAAIKAKTDLIPASPAAVSDIPSASSIADAVWDETTSGHTTAGTYGGRLLRSTGSNVEVLVTGANHIAADVHEFQADVLTSNALATGAITADALAADVATEIAAGVWDATIASHVSAGSTGLALRDADLRGSRTVIRGTVGAATTPSTTQFTPSSISPAGAAIDQFKGRIIIFDNDTTTAALRGQASDITANSNASTPLLTFTSLTTAPASGDTFSIV